MRCPHLKGNKVKACGEKSGLYVPSIFELEEYCQTARSVQCPFLFKGGADKRQSEEGWNRYASAGR